MKPAKKFIYFLLFALPVLFLACKDDEDEISREELIIGTWQLSSQEIVSVTLNGQTYKLTEQNIAVLEQFGYSIPESYFSPNTTFTFNSDKTYEIDDPEVSEKISGDWSLSSDESTLNFSLNGQQATAPIDRLTEDNLSFVLSIPRIEIEGIPKEIGGTIRLILAK